MIQIPQSTSRVVMLKLFLTGTTTAATGKTLAIVLSKAGGEFANPNAGASNATEVANGWYKFTIDTTDTATLGDLVVRGTAASCDDSERCFAVVKATNAGLTGVPDAVAGANAGLPVLSSSATTLAYTISTLTTYTGNTPQTGDNFARIGVAGVGLTNVVLPAGGLANVTAWTVAITGNVTGNLSGSVGSVTGAVGSVTGLTASNLDAAISSRMATYTQPTGFLTASFPTDPADQSLIIAATDAVMARLGAPAGASHAADVAAVKVDSAAIKAKTDQFVFTIANQVNANALSGGGGLDAAGVRAAIGMAAANLDTQLDGILASTGGGPGSIAFTVTINDDMATPLDGAEVWVSTDVGGSNVIAGTLSTDAMGQATFLLDAGNYFLWVAHSGFNRTNPTAITVT